tara:strand:+ start:1242 stop:2048 length:807 start_codon:yes stop_codon:yes gene_type:complete
VKNILLLTSNKNLKNKNFIKIINYLNKKRIKFQHIDINIDKDEFKNIKFNTKSLILSFGGDGTALKAMKLGWKYKLDVLSFGPGRVGYLVRSLNEFNNLIDQWVSNKSTFVKRFPIIQNKDLDFPSFNEVVIIKNSPTRLLDLSILTYNQKVDLRADGIIISTSLGSTAYNYSAGGPIVHNDIDSMIITPISPFSKFPRSIVVSRDTKLDITIKKNQNFAVQFDGKVEVEECINKDLIYEYGLSKKALKIIGDDNNPKLDKFLNQILR